VNAAPGSPPPHEFGIPCPRRQITRSIRHSHQAIRFLKCASVARGRSAGGRNREVPTAAGCFGTRGSTPARRFTTTWNTRTHCRFSRRADCGWPIRSGGLTPTSNGGAIQFSSDQDLSKPAPTFYAGPEANSMSRPGVWPASSEPTRSSEFAAAFATSSLRPARSRNSAPDLSSRARFAMKRKRSCNDACNPCKLEK